MSGPSELESVSTPTSSPAPSSPVASTPSAGPSLGLRARLHPIADGVRRALRGAKRGTELDPHQPLELDFEVDGGAKAYLTGLFESAAGANDKGAVVAMTFFDDSGAPLTGPYPGFSTSKRFDAYRYVPVGDDSGEAAPFKLAFQAPAGARRLRARFYSWKPVAPPQVVQAVRLFQSQGKVVERALGERLGAGRGAIERGSSSIAFGVRVIGSTYRPRGAIGLISFFDRSGRVLPPPYDGLGHSPRFGPYRYLSVAPERDPRSGSGGPLPCPKDAASVEIVVHAWDAAEPLTLVREPAFAPANVQGLTTLRRSVGDSHGGLEALADLARAHGDLDAQIEATSALVGRFSETKAQAPRLTLLRGIRRELDTRWTPDIDQRPEAAPRGDPGRPRICHLFKVSYPFENSGGSIRNLNIVKSQKLAGLDPYVVTPLGYPDHEVPAVETIEGVDHHRLLAPSQAVSAWPRDKALSFDALAAASVIRTRGADVIHAASGVRGYDAALKGLALARRFDLPLVYEVRSFHEHTWSPLRPDIMELGQTRLRIAQEDRCMREADHVVTISNAMRDNLLVRGVQDDRLTVVPNAIDAAKFQAVDPEGGARLRSQLGLGDAPVIGYVSNMSRREGHDILIDAVAKLSARHPTIRLVLVGDGGERAALERQVGELGLTDRTLFTGEIDHDQVLAYYQLYDVFVVPRRADFAADLVTPLKPFEAMALGCTLLMSDRPVTNEILGDETRGLMFRSEDAEDLAAKLDALIRQPDAAKTFAEAGRRWVYEHRTWTANAKLYVALYEALLERRKRIGVRPGMNP